MGPRSIYAPIAALLGTLLLTVPPASADLIPGPISDFDDGSTQGWSPPRGNTSVVNGSLQVTPAPFLAAFNADVAGVLDPAVTDIQLDLMRPDGQTDLEMRLVLFGPGTSTRWTSTLAQVVPGDGVFRTYTFSVLESELTRVDGTNSYAELAAGLDRIMIRFDDGPPSARGSVGPTGSFRVDNVVALPEPGSVALLSLAGILGLARRRPAPGLPA